MGWLSDDANAHERPTPTTRIGRFLQKILGMFRKVSQSFPIICPESQELREKLESALKDLDARNKYIDELIEKYDRTIAQQNAAFQRLDAEYKKLLEYLQKEGIPLPN